MEQIIDKIACEFEQYELFYLNERSNKIEAREGEICAAEYKEEEGYALLEPIPGENPFCTRRIRPPEKNARQLW